MNLLDTMNELGHYARKAYNAVKKPLALTLAGTAMFSMLAINEAQGQTKESDTIYATGIFTASDSETGNEIEGLTFTARSDIDPNSVYTFVTDNDGWAIFDNPGLPVHIITGINENNKGNASVQPTFGNDFNATFGEIQKGHMEIYDIQGKLLISKDFNTDHIYENLSQYSSGALIYKIQTDERIVLSGKYIKQDVPSKGPSGKPTSTLKNTETYSADYWVKWEHPDYYTDSALVTLIEGNNGFINFYPVSNIIPIPQHKDLVGTAKKSKDEGYGPLANITAILYNQTTNQTTQLTTGSDGKFVFEDVPAGSICWISVGGNDSRYSFNDIYFEIESEIQNMNDTIADIFSTIHPNKLATTTSNRIVQTSRHGVLSQERKVWYDPNIPNIEVNTYEGWFDQLEGMSDSYTYTQVTDESEADIKIYNGAPGTGTNVTSFITPLKTYSPVTVATVTLNTAGDFGTFCHEIYQANGKSQTNFGILGPNPPSTGPTQEDLDIDRLDMQYWVYGVYTDQETNVDLNLISEDLDNKSPQYKGNLGAGFSIGKK